MDEKKRGFWKAKIGANAKKLSRVVGVQTDIELLTTA